MAEEFTQEHLDRMYPKNPDRTLKVLSELKELEKEETFFEECVEKLDRILEPDPLT